MTSKTSAELCLNGRGGSGAINVGLMFALASALLLADVQMASAQTETVLYTFNGGVDGRYPYNDRLLRDANGNIYGTTEAGGGSGCYGSFGCGTVFKLSPDGVDTILHRFAGGSDGANPYAGLVQDTEGNLYGTTGAGGTSGCGGSGCGIVFTLAPTDEEKVLHRFSGVPDGADPISSLVRDYNGNIYGTTVAGGAVTTSCNEGCGTFFSLTPSGREQVLHRFGVTSDDGWYADASPVRDSKGNFYGTVFYGGAYGSGAVFELTASGKEKVLYSFCPKLGCAGDGQNPYSGLISDQTGNFYGTTFNGGVYKAGAVFELTATGEEKVLYSFTGRADGANPYAGLLRDESGNLYGTTVQGGESGCGGSGCGTVFEVTASGEEKTLYRFTGGADGGNPFSGLVRDADGNLYGTTIYGGDLSCYNGYYYGCGVVFKVRP